MHFEESVSTGEVLSCIEMHNNDPETSGIIVQLPLPPHIDEAKVMAAVSPQKDVDGYINFFSSSCSFN